MVNKANVTLSAVEVRHLRWRKHLSSTTLRLTCFLAFCLYFTASAFAQVQVTHFQHDTVEAGQTAESISQSHNIDFTYFLLLNGFEKDVILKPGTVVVVGEGKEQGTKPTVSSSPTQPPSKPANNLPGQPAEQDATEIKYGPAGAVYQISKSGYHTVEKNQTCFHIATIYGLTLQELKELNNLKDYNIHEGQRLKVKK